MGNAAWRGQELVMSDKAMAQKERLINLLFSREGETHRNLKLMRGPKAAVTEDELCEQINSALVRKRAGMLQPVELPRSKKTSVKKFLEAL
jgi:hypothetical protein